MTIPRILPRAEHPISRGYIDPDALRVLYRLHRAGYKGYLVGGSVRDLMTGRTPKDFDIGTDARPQEIRRLFRNSRIIGRRFRLVHILFEGGKALEVSTFRRRPEPGEVERAERPGRVDRPDRPERPDRPDRPEGDEDLLIRSDNTFGSPEEDALRRDFTINGLFYDIATFAVLDYVGGVDDLEKGLVRTIGEAAIRFREDPVRMLRACEFAARLSFTMTPEVREAIRENRGEIRKSAPPRVTEELLDPLRRGWGAATYRLWTDTGLLGELLPELVAEVNTTPSAHAGKTFWKMLAESDRRRAAGEPAPEAALLGTLFLPLVFAAVRHQAGDGKKPFDPQRILLVLEDVVNPLAARLTLPNLSVHLVKQALYTMGRLVESRPGDPAARRLVTKAYFPAAVALLSLYAAASGRYTEAAAEWEEVVARAGRRPERHEDLSFAAPFPEALVAPAVLLGRAEQSIPPALDSHDRAQRRRPRRRGGRGRHAASVKA